MKVNKGKHFIIFAVELVVIALLVAADRYLKDFAAEALSDGKLHVLVNGFLGFVYAENTGAAFSMFTSSTDVLSIVTGVLLLAGVVFLAVPVKRSAAYDVFITMIIAGGAGNLLDRLTRGFVIDYIDALFIDFPIFNFADCLITCGAFAMIIVLLVEIVKESKDKKKVIATKELLPDGEKDG